ncbi:MAG: DUF4173 domain-containing protein [Gemmatimonadetes bacterium]|nr:DUF4173 domain-containing protein [Gemmatimonadota bacterium]
MMDVPPRSTMEDLPLRWSPPDRRWFLAAAALGIAGDALLRAGPGAGLALWLAALPLVGAGLARRHGRLGWGRATVVGLGVAAAATLAVRSAPPLQLLAIGLVGLSVGWSLLERPWTSGLVARLGALTVAGFSAVALAPVGAFAARRATESDWSRRSTVAARGAVAAAPVLVLVAGLFVAGDPVFARYADRLLEAGLAEALSHLALALLLAWIAGGLVHSIAAVRVEDPALEPGPLGRFAAEAIVALLLVDLLFATFLGVQARALFGGRAFVEATAGMTYAEYARSGFFQLALAAMVALPTVLAADWIVAPTSEHRRTFVGLAYGLAAGVVLVLASGAHRMWLYVDAYGLTEARLYASAFMVWLAIVAVWLAATIAGGRSERFAAGSLVAGWVLFVAMVALNPAGLVVRVNAERASAGEMPGFDVEYGASALGIDAVPALVEAVQRLPAAEGCRVAAHVMDLRDRRLDGDPRSWTVARWLAGRAVSGHEAELRAAAVGCREERPGEGPGTVHQGLRSVPRTRAG